MMSEMQNLVDNVNKVVYKIDEPYRRPVKTVYEDNKSDTEVDREDDEEEPISIKK